jgi:hypothetical protein
MHSGEATISGSLRIEPPDSDGILEARFELTLTNRGHTFTTPPMVIEGGSASDIERQCELLILKLAAVVGWTAVGELTFTAESTKGSPHA